MKWGRLANVYQILEYLCFGPALWRCRTRYLSDLDPNAQALLLGDGDGRVCAALLVRYPRMRVLAVDGSWRMLNRARRRLPADAAMQARFVQADLGAFPVSDTQCNIVATHFVLDCLSEHDLSTLAFQVTEICPPGASWLISDFQYPKWLPGRWLINALYKAARLITGLENQSIPDHYRILSQLGWVCSRSSKSLAGLLISEVWTRTAIAYAGNPRQNEKGQLYTASRPLP